MAATLVGGAFLNSALNVLFDRLASEEFINFFRGRKHDERLLNDLKLKLIEVDKLLNDAEDKEITDPAVKRWLDELKDAIYHADDLVDEIAYKALRSKVEAEYQSGSNQVQSLISTFASLFDRGIASKLEKVIGMLDKFVKAKDVLGLREVVGQNWSQTRLPTTSLVDETCVYGRETNKEEIMKLLLSDGESSKKVDVIPIVGMGGVGKTTLAQLLYGDGRVNEHFDKKAWVCVSDIFDVSRITRTIVEAVTGSACDAKELESLQVKLKESLSGKKFLIVLDDVWNENYGHSYILMAPFRFGDGAHGSKIIVTTRNESVASIMQTVPFHGLRELPNEECWKLFSRHAFEEGDCNAYPNLEKIGKEIVEKCKGLPLAAKTVGGLLRSKRDIMGWNVVLKSGIWDLPKEKSSILPALRLSYHYLPSYLKRCFAYCSVFVKDYEFEMKELVSTWIAEGFLEKPKNNKTMEEQGYECFNELLSRSFFQRSNANNSCFVMHDLIHDLAQFVIGDFLYRLEDGMMHGISEKVRHFSYVQGHLDVFDKLKEITEAKYLRTFLPLNTFELSKGIHGYYRGWLSKKVVDEILPRLTRLRLVSLSKYGIMELPHSIGDLIHLRFLDLSCTLISQLPESVCILYNLETLLLSGCHLLTTLPVELGNLILLRRLDLIGTNLKEMPMHMSSLKRLEQLTAFVVGKNSGSTINELKEFHHLCGTISISGLQNVTSSNDALEARIGQKEHLETLTLEWVSTTDDSQKERDVLEKLQPHMNLKHLNIKNYGGTRFPVWLGDQSFSSMVSLRLENCENCISMPPLGQLCSLKDLTISRMSGITEVGHGFYGKSGSLSKPFESLETLRFEEMLEWVDWCIIDAEVFSQLQNLEVIKCPKLTGHLPKKVPSLVRLEIRECPKLVASLPRTTSIRELALEKCQGVQLEWQGVSSVETLGISGFSSFEEFSRELVTLKNLKKLDVAECPRLLSFPEGMMSLNNFKRLLIESCPNLVLPLSLEMSHCYRSLEWLALCGCESLQSLPLGLFPKLRFLFIKNCKNFETLLIPDGIELQNLDDLRIIDCVNIVSFPCRELPAPNLSTFYVMGCDKLKALPERMHTLLPSLQSLGLFRCPEIESFPEGGLPSKLSGLYIGNCKKLVRARRDWGLQTLTFLINIELGGESEDVLESFPEEGLLPFTLRRLRIDSLQNLKSLNKRGLQLLGSLERIRIDNCHQLESLPEGLPISLITLEITDCPLLKSRYRREEAEEWRKIAHVAAINMDGEGFIDQVYLGPVPYEFPRYSYMRQATSMRQARVVQHT